MNQIYDLFQTPVFLWFLILLLLIAILLVYLQALQWKALLIIAVNSLEKSTENASAMIDGLAVMGVRVSEALPDRDGSEIAELIDQQSETGIGGK